MQHIKNTQLIFTFKNLFSFRFLQTFFGTGNRQKGHRQVGLMRSLSLQDKGRTCSYPVRGVLYITPGFNPVR